MSAPQAKLILDVPASADLGTMQARYQYADQAGKRVVCSGCGSEVFRIEPRSRVSCDYCNTVAGKLQSVRV